MSDILNLLKDHFFALHQRLKDSDEKRVYNLSLPHMALLLLFHDKPFIAVEDSPESAVTLYNDLLFFKATLPHPPLGKGGPEGGDALYLPPSSNPETIGERAKTLLDFITSQDISLIMSEEACHAGLTVSGMEGRFLDIRKGAEIKRDELAEWLIAHGYNSVSVVIEKGEFSRREWIFDIYPVTEDSPVRLEFFGDEIELIRKFDIESQRSIAEIAELTLFPASEGDLEGNLLDELLKTRNMDVFSSAELPEFEASGISDSLPSELPSFRASELVSVSHLPFVSEGIDSMELSLKGLGILAEERSSFEDLPQALLKNDKKIVVVLPSTAQVLRFKEIMADAGHIAPIIEARQLSLYEGNLCVVVGRLSSGINIPGLLLLTDREIFGERPAYRPIKKSKVSRLLLSMDDLKPGDFIVHKDHGIGRFNGFQRQKSDGYEEDVLSLEYANGRIYVPFQSIERLQKYSAGEGFAPPLDKLGGKAWQRTKQKTRKKIMEMAEKLLKLYAERTVSRGFTFSEDTPMHTEFDDFFAYEETPDQLSAIRKITEHMHSEKPMDMLVCGDVGYGKTEVAIRAAFRAIFDGKQVAVLVPTTLLAEQHYRTFKMRFSAFPVNIDYLSRFRTKEELKKCIKEVINGEVDIVIGTHMLLNKKIQFHDLGLLVIDEEHRFGVAQKERLMELRKAADVLTLTATPIPRTLQMSLSGCTIETPPEERLAVKSVVTVYNERTIKEAIEKELKKGGQVFFVHNRIRDIAKTAAFIKKLAPDARIATGHGQMHEHELENIMLGFLNGDTNVLVCTSIIGSGLDIPTANTIIIDRADSFGLSDLYQLRGRVGRGNTQAYSYFLIPGEDLITDDAKKRLKAIQEMSYLGAGFRLALKDLEIRGAGNMLGPEQSGYISGVGFDMYMEMLEKAVAELKGEEIRDEIEPQIRLRLSAFIPENYIPDITLRLSIYKRISSAKTIDALSEIEDDIRDRFGIIPDEIRNLLHVMRTKILARALNISKVFDIDDRYRFIMVTEAGRMPDDFFDRLLKVLFELQGKNKGGLGIRFFPDGFELDARSILTESMIEKVEETLQEIIYRMTKEAPS